jgi:AcrR family transcriptional regulator
MPLAAALPSRSGQRERNKLDKLRRIKDAARELFVAKGFDDTTTREIAVRAGVGIGTIFVYAENKRDLLFLIANEDLETVTVRAEAAVTASASLMQNLLSVATLHYEFFARQPELSRLVLREMVFYESGAQAGRFQRTRERLITLFGRSVEIALAQKTVTSSETPQFVGWTIFAVFQVELRRWLSTDEPSLSAGVKALERALRLVISGIAPDASALSSSKSRPRSVQLNPRKRKAR